MQSVGHDKCIPSIADFTARSIDCTERKKEMAGRLNRPDDPFIYDEIWKAKMNCGRFIFALNVLLIPPNEAV